MPKKLSKRVKKIAKKGKKILKGKLTKRKPSATLDPKTGTALGKLYGANTYEETKRAQTSKKGSQLSKGEIKAVTKKLKKQDATYKKKQKKKKKGKK